MEYKIAELKNNLHKDNKISGQINYNHKVKDDIEAVSPVEVEGTYSYDKIRDGYDFNLMVRGDITILSAISLKPIKLLIDFNTNLFYTFKVTDDDSFLIDGVNINLDEEIWGEIILHLPSRVMEEGEEFDESDNIIIEEENPFKKLLKEE
ncbi:MAG: DUF177 domain-containing protein [Gammaproteobacteria bacterium]|nr:DUF177 domain-containing protein [Gammaproteobacteria bacterium]